MSVLWFGGFFRWIAVTTRLNANLLKKAVLVDHREWWQSWLPCRDCARSCWCSGPGTPAPWLPMFSSCVLCCLRLAATGRAADTTGSQDWFIVSLHSLLTFLKIQTIKSVLSSTAVSNVHQSLQISASPLCSRYPGPGHSAGLATPSLLLEQGQSH